jgi:hypothetical protein
MEFAKLQKTRILKKVKKVKKPRILVIFITPDFTCKNDPKKGPKTPPKKAVFDGDI